MDVETDLGLWIGECGKTDPGEIGDPAPPVTRRGDFTCGDGRLKLTVGIFRESFLPSCHGAMEVREERGERGLRADAFLFVVMAGLFGEEQRARRSRAAVARCLTFGRMIRR